MYQIPLATSSTTVSEIGFWNSVFIYHDRPHIVNRKLAGISQATVFEVDFNSKSISNLREAFSIPGLLYEVRKLKTVTKDYLNEHFIKCFLEPYDKNVDVQEITLEKVKLMTEGCYISVKVLLPRNKLCERGVEITVLDRDGKRATFFAVNDSSNGIALAPTFPYVIELTNSGHLRLCVDKFEEADTSSAEWLSYNVFQKLMKWTEHINTSQSSLISSLSLIAVDDYVAVYHNLKAKYAGRIIKIWPENTDPQKFVFEDVAIASYLICLWKRVHGNKKPSFVDLGCGNGLLVYILSEEGYPGFGIDVRARKIWNLYPENVKLEVKTLTLVSTTFTNSNWIIGNHSDELTLWIPVIALRSSLNTNFFVLPCCAYNFNGRKYQRLNSSQSQYSEYVNCTKDIAIKCGFDVKTDKLRIPSTKRTCLVGYERVYKSDDHESIKNDVAELINLNLQKNSLISRSTKEPVRNCTKLNRELVNRIIKKCVEQLLEKENCILKTNGKKWNKGGVLEFSLLSKTLPSEDLKQLKNECGGLQTLLRNHRYLFIVENGRFSLRAPLPKNDANSKYGDKICWFNCNHPDGCLHEASFCAYKHV